MENKNKLTIYQQDNIDKKNNDVDKKVSENSLENDELINLISQIVFENLLLKYRRKHSEMSFNGASETPDRLKNK